MRKLGRSSDLVLVCYLNLFANNCVSPLTSLSLPIFVENNNIWWNKFLQLKEITSVERNRFGWKKLLLLKEIRFKGQNSISSVLVCRRVVPSTLRASAELATEKNTISSLIDYSVERNSGCWKKFRMLKETRFVERNWKIRYTNELTHYRFIFEQKIDSSII